MSVSVVDPVDAAALIEWSAAIRRSCVEDRVGAWWPSDESVLAQFADPPSGRRRWALVYHADDGSVAGAADVAVSDGDPAEVTVGVLPEHRRRGRGTALWEAARELLAEHSPAVVQSETWSAPGVAFAERIGLSIANSEFRMLRDSASAAPDAPAVSGVDVVAWTGAVPDGLLGDWVRLNASMRDDVPLGELTRRATVIDPDWVRAHEKRMSDQGWILVRAMARAGSRGVGYTVIFVARDGDEIIVQDDTFVEGAYRGRGIARLLKAENLRQLRSVPAAAAARWVQTSTAVDNSAMLSLNRAIGFEVADISYALEGPLAIS
ncbi:GNAT family N-acetyltransferase [Microbacterium esteraromaticum]|uniref:GNAT family N-acetyltransferase n=1 Tax=Microbacterium esteraromaticum TaxID=57043 RepID=UPI001959B766|nr:GNAT superfamily N-acetyltransferase [Microbacterium esteraromaticum]